MANRIRFAGNTTNAIEEGDTPSIYRALIGELAGDGLAYLNIAWPEPLVANPTLPWPGPLPADDGRARPGVHRQPDLVGRYRTGAPLNPCAATISWIAAARRDTPTAPHSIPSARDLPG